MPRNPRLIMVVSLLFFCFSFIGSNPSETKSAALFASTGFEQLWDYSDKVVSEIPQAGRGFTWGPSSLAVLQENYLESPGGKRTVQFFDKSRMELGPDGKSVTNGLLTKELVTGRLQTGDKAFGELPPSLVQIAGDENGAGRNQNSPVYASFSNLVTLEPGQNTAPNGLKQVANLAINKAGEVTSLANPPVKLLHGFYDQVLGHNIPQVFYDYMNLEGQIWNGTNYHKGKIFTTNPTANVFGYPISEPFWIKTEVAFKERDVLVQLFERRVLTYTPSNPDPFKVEMGNVGIHYLEWRYKIYQIGPVNPLAAKHTVVIDPGHGGSDSGATHNNSTGQVDQMEKNVTLKIGLKTANLLEQAGYRVILTRKDDNSPNNPPRDLTGDGLINVSDDLQARVNLANANQADLFLSIHSNASRVPNGDGGYETFYCADRPFSGKSRLFAQLLQQESVSRLKNLLGYPVLDRGYKDDFTLYNRQAHLFILGPKTNEHKTASNMPGALTEALFLNNDVEEALLIQERTLDLLAGGYAKAVELYFSSN